MGAELIGAFLVECTRLKEVRTPDGQGGFFVRLEDVGTFQAALVKDKTNPYQVAEKDAVKEKYIVTTLEECTLSYHDLFRRNSDGCVFRVTGNAQDSKPPACASFYFQQTTAERREGK